MKKFILPLLGILAMMAALVPVTVSAAPAELHVGPGQTYATIQDAVDAAKDDDTIVVHAGIYDEQVLVEEFDGLTIKGLPGAVVQPTTADVTTSYGYVASGIITVIDATDVTIEGLTIDGSARMSLSGNLMGIVYQNGSGTITDNVVQHTRKTVLGGQGDNAIYVRSDDGGSSVVTISGNTVSDYGKNGITANMEGTVANIVGNTVTGGGPTAYVAQNGIQLWRAAGEVTDNQVSGNRYTGVGWGAMGILLIDFDSGLVKGNEVSGSNTGIYLFNCDDNEVLENEVTDSTHEGIFLHSGSSGNLVKENQVSDDWWGIVINDADSNEVIANEISDSLTGILLCQFAEGNEVRDNEVTADFEGVFILGASGNLIEENEVSHSGWGIVLNGANDNDVIGNEVADSTAAGISAWWSSGNLIKANEVSDSGWLDLYDSSAPSPLDNTWQENECTTSWPDGLCGEHD